jgi:hypothetical protein
VAVVTLPGKADGPVVGKKIELIVQPDQAAGGEARVDFIVESTQRRSTVSVRART